MCVTVDTLRVGRHPASGEAVPGEYGDEAQDLGHRDRRRPGERAGHHRCGSRPRPPAGSRQEAGDDRYDVYVGKLDRRELEVLRASGIDPHDLGAAAAGGGQFDVEVVVSGDEAEALADQGIDLELKEVDGESAAEMSTRLAQAGHAVFRPYGGPGNLKEEFEQIAADNPDIAELVVIG